MQSREADSQTPKGSEEAVRLFDRGLRLALRDALLITLVSAALAAGVNLLHPRGIPFIAKRAYEILVPCPEPGGAVTALSPADARVKASDSFRIDARAAEAFERWHLPGAMNLTFDYLDPTPKAKIRAVAQAAARSKAKRVVVYGDGDDPDSGEQLGKELSGAGLKNVLFVRGGAKALQPKAVSPKGAQPKGAQPKAAQP